MKGFLVSFKQLYKNISLCNCYYSTISYQSIPKHLQEKLELYGYSKFEEFINLSQSISSRASVSKELAERYNHLRPFSEVMTDIDLLKLETNDLAGLMKDAYMDSEMVELAQVESNEKNLLKESLYNKLISLILPPEDSFDEVSEISLEILAGVGGQEAMLFAADLMQAYQRFADKKNWMVDETFSQLGEAGGIRACRYRFSGNGAFDFLKYESGIHRVQRVPVTSSLGKIHTSTVAVVVLPIYETDDIIMNESDLKWDFFKASGPGGQHVNRTESAVRVTHIPTNTIVGCQSERLQQSNKKLALEQLMTMLQEKQYEAKLQRLNTNRRVFIGSRARSDKIRTYNYQQDRITEHRIHRSWPNIAGFMNGGDLESIISALRQADVIDRLENVLSPNECGMDSNKC